MADTGVRIPPPYSPPDCEWIEMTPGKAVPEKVLNVNGKLNGDPIYIGRVFDDGCYYVGTAVPNKGHCVYQTHKGEVKSSASYDILTVWIPTRLLFKDDGLDDPFSRYLAGGNDDICLYAARVKDGENVYIGWVEEEAKIVHIPKDPASGSNKIKEGYDVVIHTPDIADQLQVCPGGPC